MIVRVPQPRRRVVAANRRLPNTRWTKPGTCTSTSSDGHDKASPAGETKRTSSFDVDARSRPGIMLRGIEIALPPPNIRSTRSRPSS